MVVTFIIGSHILRRYLWATSTRRWFAAPPGRGDRSSEVALSRWDSWQTLATESVDLELQTQRVSGTTISIMSWGGGLQEVAHTSYNYCFLTLTHFVTSRKFYSSSSSNIIHLLYYLRLKQELILLWSCRIKPFVYLRNKWRVTLAPNAREMTLPTVLRSDWLIVPTRPRKSALNRTCSNFWIVRMTRFRDTRFGSDSLPHDTIYSVARQSGVLLRVDRNVWQGL